MQPEQWVVLLPSFACVHALQENVKARHPQLLYESKLYKILQGGGGCTQAPTTASSVHATWTAYPAPALLLLARGLRRAATCQPA